MQDSADRETIINFNERDVEASIYTYNAKWIEQLKKLGFKPIEKFKHANATAYEFIVPKSIISMPRVAKKNKKEGESNAGK